MLALFVTVSDIVDDKDVSRSVQLNSGFLPIALVTLSWLVKDYILHGTQLQHALTGV